MKLTLTIKTLNTMTLSTMTLNTATHIIVILTALNTASLCTNTQSATAPSIASLIVMKLKITKQYNIFYWVSEFIHYAECRCTECCCAGVISNRTKMSVGKQALLTLLALLHLVVVKIAGEFYRPLVSYPVL